MRKVSREGLLKIQEGRSKGVQASRDKRSQNIIIYNEDPERCKFCNTPIAYDKRRNDFCSRSCSAKYTNGRRDNSSRRNPKNYCKVCGKRSRNSSSQFCREHWIKNINEERGLLTKEEATRKTEYSSANKYQLIRQHGIDTLRIEKIEKKCKICGYTNHVEVCHIISIGEFSNDTLLKVINSLNNLVYLCPNHHWELDNNYLRI